jgi:hypothetical protein
MGTGTFPGEKRPGRVVDHPPHLAPRLRKEYGYTSNPPTLWAFVACSRVNFTLPLVKVIIFLCDTTSLTRREEQRKGSSWNRQANACDKRFLPYECPTKPYSTQPAIILQTTNTAAGNSAQDSESLVPSVSLWKEVTRSLNLYLCLLLLWALSL